MLRCCNFWEMSKTVSWKYGFTCIIFISWSVRRKLFSWHCITHFSKTTAPQQVRFSGKLSTIIVFKLCKLNVNLLTLCFCVKQKVHTPFNDLLTFIQIIIKCFTGERLLFYFLNNHFRLKTLPKYIIINDFFFTNY